MKKIIFSVMMVLSLCTTASANEVKVLNRINTVSLSNSINVGDDKKFDFNINYRQLSKYLCLNDSDKANVIGVMEGFRDGMSLAGKVENNKTKEKLIINSIDFTVRNMKDLLNREQYSKFLSGFNLTLINRGFEKEISLYSWRNTK